MGRGRTRGFNILELLILKPKNMKKEYIKPSMKVVGMNVESVILAGSNAKLDVDWTASEGSEGITFNDYDVSDVDHDM
jgi:hypothetical protein